MHTSHICKETTNENKQNHGYQNHGYQNHTWLVYRCQSGVAIFPRRVAESYAYRYSKYLYNNAKKFHFQVVKI